MTFLNLIFGRKPRAANLVGPVEILNDATMDSARSAPGSAEGQVLPTVQSIGHQATPPVLGLILGGSQPLAERRRAVFAELSAALSLHDVALIGTESSARLLVANRRVLAARFLRAEGHLDFDLRHDLPSEDAALQLHRAVAGILAAPIDLIVENRPAAGVYSANGGLPVDLLSAEEPALRAAFTTPGAPDPALGNATTTPQAAENPDN